MPIVPAPGDYDDGEIDGMIGRGYRSTRRKPAPVPLCPTKTPHAARTRTRAAVVGSPATNRLSYGTATRFLLTTVKPIAYSLSESRVLFSDRSVVLSEMKNFFLWFYFFYFYFST
jgi:hypothetical protein